MKKILIAILSVSMLFTAILGLTACKNSNVEFAEVAKEELQDFYYFESATGYIITGLKNTELEEVVIPDGIIGINEKAFFNNDTIKSITLPKTVKVIGDNAFDSCVYLSKVEFKEGSTIEKIGAFAFKGCSALEEIIIPDSVKNIGTCAFLDCNMLLIKAERANIPNGWENGWNTANRPIIYNCKTNLVANDGNIYVSSNGLKFSIANQQAKVVRQSSTITKADIPSYVKAGDISYPVVEIIDSAFEGCYDLLEIYIPQTVNKVGDRIFFGARAVIAYVEATSLSGEWGAYWNKRYDYNNMSTENDSAVVLNYKNNNVATDGKVYMHINGLLYELDLETKTASIEMQSFNIKEAIFVDTITYNDENYIVCNTARFNFWDSTKLTKIVLPKNLKTIPWYFLQGCKSLKEVFVPKSVEKV